MKFRHECKYEISEGDRRILHSRLSKVMNRDVHVGLDGKYQIISMYFDTPGDRALMDKVNGTNPREKFRFRYYNGDTSHIRLEKKSKYNNYTQKTSVAVSCEECEKIIRGEIDWMLTDERLLLAELYGKMQCSLLRPKTISIYEREPYVYAPGNVRITIDSGMETAIHAKDFLHVDRIATAPSGAREKILLEVKYDEFLPEHIRSMIQLKNCRLEAYSKYAASRIYS